jgi:hypothetical protein
MADLESYFKETPFWIVQQIKVKLTQITVIILILLTLLY